MSNGYLLPELNTPLNRPEKCQRLVRDAGFEHVTVSTAQAQRSPGDPETSFERAWAGRTRFNIDLPAGQVAKLRAQYVAEFTRLLPQEDDWNQDYEQYVVAYKGMGYQ